MVEVHWTENAEADLENIYRYISTDSVYFADQVVDDLIAASLKLEEYPKVGRIIPESEEENLREIFVFSYRLMYEILDSTRIDILSVLHGTRDFQGFNQE